MKSYWILPDANSTGIIKVFSDGNVTNLADLDVWKTRPKVIFPAIPKEIMLLYKNKNVIYAQYARMESFNIFCLSTPHGLDIHNRIVQLTNLQVLDKNERPSLDFSTNLPDNDQIIKCAKSILAILANHNSAPYKKVTTMISAFDDETEKNTFSSETLTDSALVHDWMPKKKWFNICQLIKAVLSFFGKKNQ